MVAKPRILVVDDEPVVRESIRDWFNEDDYPIEMASDGPEAMQKIICAAARKSRQNDSSESA